MVCAVTVLALLGVWFILPPWQRVTPTMAPSPATAVSTSTSRPAPATAIPTSAPTAACCRRRSAARRRQLRRPRRRVAPTPTASPQERLQAARAAVERRDFRRATELLGALQQSDPSTPDLDTLFYQARLGYGQALLEAGDLDGSWGQYSEALTLRPDDPAVLAGQKQVVLARHWRQMEAAWSRDDEAAVAELDAILQLDSGYRDASHKLYAKLMSKVDGLLAAGDQRAAFPRVLRVLQVEPQGPEALRALGNYTAVSVADAGAILVSESFDDPAQARFARSSDHPSLAEGYQDGEYKLQILTAEVVGGSSLKIPVRDTGVSVAVDVRLEGDTARIAGSRSPTPGRSGGAGVCRGVLPRQSPCSGSRPVLPIPRERWAGRIGGPRPVSADM